MSERRLYRSSDAWIGGVCAGVSEYFGWDKVITRLLYLIVTIAGVGAGFIIYVILWMIVPKENTY